MPCFHKFFGHPTHMVGENGLLPNWDADTLIVGTFNPSNEWVSTNSANYFYGRTRNYFWSSVPRFANSEEINKSDLNSQLEFLKKNRIALTDLLISIEDACIKDNDHLNRICSFKDDDLNVFKQFKWNIDPIKEFIEDRNIKAVFFTKLGGNGIFEGPIVEIENFCKTKSTNSKRIITNRLFTPSGQKLGAGRPRKYRLMHKWFNENGANQFPFLSSEFDINNFKWSK